MLKYLVGIQIGQRLLKEVNFLLINLILIYLSTEGYENLLPKDGYIISSHEDYGYKTKKGRRKVILWSKNKWTEVDQIGSKKFHQEDLYQVLQMESKLLVFVFHGDLRMSVQGEKIVNHGRIISLLLKI